MPTDIFGRTPGAPKIPFTADKATIDWGGPITTAMNVNITYSQTVQRRRTIGNKDTVIFASMPVGQITIARLLTDDATTLFASPGWNVCTGPATIKVTFRGGCSDQASASTKEMTLTAIGCIVSQFSISAEAEGLTVVDQVMIDFLQLQAAS